MKSNHGILHKSALFAAALIWGSSFFIVKNSVSDFSPNILLGIRFTIGCILLSLIFYKKLRFITRALIWKGGLTGLFLCGAYCLQTIGITDTTPGKNAFLTAIYCVLVPFFYWVIYKIRPDRYNFLAATLCIAGIGLVSLTGDFSIRFGDALTLAGGVFYALHMVAVAKFGMDQDSVLFTIIQFASAAAASWIVGFCFEGG
ncbi:MAG: DMT family transporter, partial [Pygmaiobacter sp.]